MKKLADEHLEILRNLNENGIELLDDISNAEAKPYLHLRDLKLIIYGYTYPDHHLRAEISNEGKDYLASLDDEEKRFRKTTFIAILALIISIASLLFDIIEKVH